MKVTKDVKGKDLPCELYLDGFLHTSLTSLDKYRTNNFDVVGLITGEEGSGKTTLAMQAALYLDAGFNNKHIVFNSDQFEEAIKTLPFGSVILWDEADDLGSGWASEMMISLKKTFKRIRKRNYIILCVTPTFHDLNKYFAIHRTRFLIDVYVKDIKRGRFKLFKRNTKRLLYIRGKKEMNMQAAKANYRGAFTDYPKGFPVDMDAYEAAKDAATIAAIDKNGGSKDLRMEIYANIRNWLDNKNIEYKRADLGSMLGVSTRQVSNYRRELGLNP